MRQDDCSVYRGAVIIRKSTIFRRLHYIVMLVPQLWDVRFSTRTEAESAIDAALGRGEHVSIANNSGMKGFTHQLSYRTRTVARTEDRRGSKCYQIENPSHKGLFSTIDDAIAAIDETAEALERIDAPKPWDSLPMKANLEK